MSKRTRMLSLLGGAVVLVAALSMPATILRGRSSLPDQGATVAAPLDNQSRTLASQILAETGGVQGGLVVHVGCGDGKLTAALRASDSYLVHGLDARAENVATAREHIRSLGLYGAVAVDQSRGNRLPYIDNLVNLLVAERAPKVRMAEVLRVLAPNGVAYIKKGGKWTKTVKPRPAEIDEWTHYLHDATNNAVAHDTVVGPPRHLQWIGSPRYSRHHDHMSAISAMVSAGGRLFYIFDHASPQAIQLPSKWLLVGRDAFSGTILWKRPIDMWHTQMFRLKSGPAQLPRRLVATGERVYATLGLEAPVSALDAATGETVRTYQQTEGTEEIILADGVLLLLVNDSLYRQHEFINAFTLSQLEHLDYNNAKRQEFADYLTAELEQMPGISGPYCPEYAEPVHFRYVVGFDPGEAGLDVTPRRFRVAMEKALQAEGVPTGQWQRMPVPGQDVFQEKKGYGKGCPWTCPFYGREVEYRAEDYPETMKFVDSHSYVTGVYPPNEMDLMELYVQAFRKIADNAARVLQLTAEEVTVG